MQTFTKHKKMLKLITKKVINYIGMKIINKNKSAEKAFSSAYISKANYPKPVIKRLASIENFIEQAESLLDIIKYPQVISSGNADLL